VSKSLILRDPWKDLRPTQLIMINPRLYAKLEVENPTGSIKDRPILYIVRKAIEAGKINKDTVLVEASSGNTGISLSAVGAALGLPVIIVMPVNMSVERKQMMKLFGSEILDAPPSDFSKAIDMRNELIEENDNYWSPMQFENRENINCHRDTTAHEIFSQIPSGSSISAFFSGAGTGGTIMGFRDACIFRGTDTKCILVKPDPNEDVHGIQGIGDGDDYLVNRSLLDGEIIVSTQKAKERSRKFAQERGVLIGISAGANLVAAEKYIKENNPPGIVVTILCDRGERYLSVI
jgi:cysteine synthase